MAARERQEQIIGRLNYPSGVVGEIQRHIPRAPRSEGFVLSRSDKLLAQIFPLAQQIHDDLTAYLHEQFGQNATPQNLSEEQRHQVLEHAGTFSLGEEHFEDGTPRVRKMSRKELTQNLPAIMRQIAEVSVAVLEKHPLTQQIEAPLILLDPQRVKQQKKPKKGEKPDNTPHGTKESPKGRGINAPTGSGKSIDVFETAAVCALLDDDMSLEIHETREDLAIRNFMQMAPALHALGLRAAIILTDGNQYVYDPTITEREGLDQQNLRHVTRIQAYQDVDITWGVYTEFGHDYERDNLELDPARVRQPKPLHQRRVIIDEDEDIRIKNAHTPLVSSEPIAPQTHEEPISAEIPYTHTEMALIMAHIVEQLQEGVDFTRDIQHQQAWLIEPADADIRGRKHKRTRETAQKALHTARSTRQDIYIDLEHLDSPTPIPSSQPNIPNADLREIDALEAQGFVVGTGIPQGDARAPIGIDAVEYALRRVGLLKPEESLYGYSEEVLDSHRRILDDPQKYLKRVLKDSQYIIDHPDEYPKEAIAAHKKILDDPNAFLERTVTNSQQILNDQERIMTLYAFFIPALQVKAFYRRGIEYDLRIKEIKLQGASVLGPPTPRIGILQHGLPTYEILVRDTHRGRVVPGRRFSDGIHAALEARERIVPDNQDKYIPINLDTKSNSSILTRSFYRRYGEVFGFSGTATGAAHEFFTFYGTDVISIPSLYENARQVTQYERLHATKEGKMEDILQRVANMYLYTDNEHYRAPLLIDLRLKEDVVRMHALLQSEFVDPYNRHVDFLFSYINYYLTQTGKIPASLDELISRITTAGFSGQEGIQTFEQFAQTHGLQGSRILSTTDLREFFGPIQEQVRVYSNSHNNTQPTLNEEFFAGIKEASHIQLETLTDDIPLAEAEARVRRTGTYGHIIVTNIIEIGSDPTLGGTAPKTPEEIGQWQAIMDLLLEKQGLGIIGEHRDSTADLQLIGRTARQGYPGFVMFVSSAEDEFILQGLSIEEREDLLQLLNNAGGSITETALDKRGREYIQSAIKNIDNGNLVRLEGTVRFQPLLDAQRERYYELRSRILFAPTQTPKPTKEIPNPQNPFVELILREVLPHIAEFKQHAQLTVDQMREHAAFIISPERTLEVHLQRLADHPEDLAGLRAYILHRLDELWSEYYEQQRSTLPLMQYRQSPDGRETAESAFFKDSDKAFKAFENRLREEILSILTGIPLP